MEVKFLETFFEIAGKESCYADCIIKLAFSKTKTKHNLENIGRALDIGLDKGFVDFNQNDYTDRNRAFFVKDAAQWLSTLTGKKYKVIVSAADYKPKKNELEIDFYALNEKNGKSGIGHFCLPNYDPLVYSKTKSEGFIYSKRIFIEDKK